MKYKYIKIKSYFSVILYMKHRTCILDTQIHIFLIFFCASINLSISYY